MIVLKIDLDYPGRVPRKWERRAHWLLRLWSLRVQYFRYDRTSRGWHVWIECRNRRTPTEIVAMQAALGSDPIRESINLLRVRRLPNESKFWRSRWNVLYAQYWPRRMTRTAKP